MALNKLVLDDFTGGLDLVSGPSAFPANCTPEARNARIDKTGEIRQISSPSTGFTMTSSSTYYPKDLFAYRYGSETRDRIIARTATRWVEWNGTSSADIRTVSAGGDAGTTFAAHGGKVYGLDETNDLGVWDGTTLTSVAPGVDTGPPRGIILGVWENRMYVAEPSEMKVWWSDEDSNGTGFFNQTGMWPADQYVILGQSGRGAEEIIGGAVAPDGVVIFTNKATHLLYGSAGQNRVVDPTMGCVSRRSIVQVGGTTFGVNDRGIFATSGSLPLEIVSGRVDPIFRGVSGSNSTAVGFYFDGSYWLAMPEVGSASTTNTICLELVVDESSRARGAIMLHDAFVAQCACRYDWAGAEYVFAAQSSTSSTISNILGFTSQNRYFLSRMVYRMPWLTLGDESTVKRVVDTRVIGRGGGRTVNPGLALRLSVRADYSPTDSLSEATVEWERGTWDSDEHQDEGRVRVSGVRGRRIQPALIVDSQSYDDDGSGGFSGEGYTAFQVLGMDDNKYVGPAFSLVEIGFAGTTRVR